MNRFIKKYTLYLSGCFSLLLSSCIPENLNNCEIYRIHFVYDYNIEFTDRFSKEATKMNLYVFDEAGDFVEEFQETKTPFFPSYNMEISLPKGRYTFIAWSGVYDDAYTIEGGEALKEIGLNDFKLRLTRLADGETDQELPGLFYGRLTSTVRTNVVDTISLMKNSKTINLSIQTYQGTQTKPLVKEDYEIKIESPSGIYDSNNNPSGSIIGYMPYMEENSTNGFYLKLNTLRLMADVKNELVVKVADSGKDLFRLDLNKIFDELRKMEYRELSMQEYLDRQDNYDIVLMLGERDGGFNSVSIAINGWIIRNENIHN